MGSSSKFDSLSYALGTNIGFDVTGQMSDIPFDFAEVLQGFEDAALSKSEVTAEAALNSLQAYFTQERPERMQIVAKKRAAG